MKSNTTMPVFFVGHGSPMNAVEDNRYSRAFTKMGQGLPRPRAILAISAHWFVDGTFVTGNPMPPTIHDFGGFPRPLYELQYPAPGSVDLAQQIAKILEERRASLATDWGLDHGTWSVLRWMFPEADVPVVQLSIDRTRPPKDHLAMGRSLASLREEGVLIVGSGNATHNLRDAFGRRGSDVPQWARDFDQALAEAVATRKTAAIEKLWPGRPDAQMAHPTPEHFLPALYAYGAGLDAKETTFPVEDFDLGSISMRSIRFG